MKKFIALITFIFILPVFAGCATPRTKKVSLVFVCTGYPCDTLATPDEQQAATEEWLQGQKPDDADHTAIAVGVGALGVAAVAVVIGLLAMKSGEDGKSDVVRTAPPPGTQLPSH